MQQYFLQEHSQSEFTIIVSLAAQNRLDQFMPKIEKMALQGMFLPC